MADQTSRDALTRRLRKTRQMRDEEPALALEAINAGVPREEVAYLLGRSREWVRRHTEALASDG